MEKEKSITKVRDRNFISVEMKPEVMWKEME